MKTFFAALAFAALPLGAQAATLSSFDVTLDLGFLPPILMADNAVVGPGPEVVSGGTAGDTITIDMTSTSTFSMLFDVSDNGGMPYATTWVFDDFQFDFPTALVTGVTMVSGDASLSSASTDGTSITVNVGIFSALLGEVKAFDFSYTSTPTPPPVVPLPATLPLLAGALGLGGLVARRRKR